MKKCFFAIVALCFLIILPSCSDDEKTTPLPELSFSSSRVFLKVGEDAQLNLLPVVSGAVYSSKDNSIATIDSHGKVVAAAVGETEVYASIKGYKRAVCEIIVEATNTLYTEPYLIFGDTKKKVKDYETLKESSTIVSETDNKIIFDRRSSVVSGVVYAFRSGLYNSSAVYINASDDNWQNLLAFLEERYFVTDYVSKVEFSNVSRRIMGQVTKETNSFVVMYFEYPDIAN